MNPESAIKNKVINAGRILVVGTQAGGKTAVITKLAARGSTTVSKMPHNQ